MMKLKLFMPAIIGLVVLSGQSQTNISSGAAQAIGMRYAGVGQLAAGDVAFTAFNADGDDDFAIVALVDIPANTTLYFTDNEPNATGNGFLDFNEGSLTWASGASVISAGTIVVFADIDAGTNTNFGASVGTLAISSFDSGLNLSGTGDALYCVEGDPGTNNISAWLAGIANATDQAGANFSATGLTVGTTFINFYTSGSPDGGVYSGLRSGQVSFASYLTLLGDSANWTTEISNGELILPISTTAFTIDGSGPLATSWTGGSGTSNWFDPLNWDNGVPSVSSTVIIPPPDAPVTIYPVVSTGTSVSQIHIQGNASGSGSLVGVENLAVTNAPPTVQRYFTGGTTTKDDPNAVYHFISSPVYEPTTISAFPGTAYIRKWNEPTQEWINLLGADVLAADKGYTLWLPAGGHTATFQGDFYDGTHAVSGLTYTAGGPYPGFDGYNLVGNPYPSGLDWDIGSWVKTNIDATIAIWNGASGNYFYWNGSVGSIVNGVIPLGHGFFVKASGVPTFTIPADAAVNPGGVLYKDEVENLLSITVSTTNDTEDQIFVNFNDDATTAYDAQYDGQKMYGLAAAPQIFTMGSDGTEMAINTLPYDDSGVTLPLHVICGENTSFTLKASELESFSNGTAIYLEDMKTNGMINLMEQPTYNFDYTVGDDPGRFTLHFEVASGTSEIENQSNIHVYAANHNIYLTSDETLNGEVYVYNLMGQIITTSRINGTTKIISMSSAGGQYIVKVISEEGAFTQKVFVK